MSLGQLEQAFTFELATSTMHVPCQKDSNAVFHYSKANRAISTARVFKNNLSWKLMQRKECTFYKIDQHMFPFDRGLPCFKSRINCHRQTQG